MARGGFPTSPGFGGNVSGDVGGLDIGAPAAGVAREVAGAARSFGRDLRRMAEDAWKREGEADATRAIAAADQIDGQVALRSGRGVDDQAFNAVARQHLSTRRKAEWMAQGGEQLIATPNSVAAFTEGLAARGAAFQPTGDPELDADFTNFQTLQNAQWLGQVRQGQEKHRQEVAGAAFVDAVAVNQTALGQAVATAGFDDEGATRVGVSLTQTARQLAQFGPREAFSLGGVEFAADPNRAGAVSAETLARVFDETQRETRVGWIQAAAERSPDSAAARAFVGQVQERWAAGDPAFAGLSIADFNQLTGRLEAGADRKAADEAATMRGAAERVREMLKAGEYGDDVDMAELRRLADQSGDIGLVAQVDFAATHGFEATPASLRAAATGGEAGVGFAAAADFLLDQLEGPGFVAADGNNGRSQWGVTEKYHGAAWADGRVDRGEATRVAREYWDAIGGDQLDPDLAVAALAAAYVGGQDTARQMLRESGGDVERFLSLEEARFRRLAGNDQRKLNGWLARQGKVRGMIARQGAQRRAAEGYASDPIGYARGNGRRPALATLAEMNPNDLFDGDAGQAGQFLQSRRATGQALAQRDGVPLALFASEEVAAIKDRIERDPVAIVTLVRRAGQALGGDGARDMLGELSRGGVTGADLRLGYLAQEPAAANIVQMVLTGRQLRADGAKPPSWEKDRGLDDAMSSLGPALATQPQAWAAVRSLAEDMAIGDMARGRLGSASSYVNSALGATERNGVRYGGAARVNGAVTVAPTWLRHDALDDALEDAARLWVQHDQGPIYANGQPMPVMALARMQLRAMPSGRYQLINPQTGRPVPARSGRAFEFDIEAQSFRERLSRRPGQTLGSR